MAQALTVSATMFARNFARYQDEAIHAKVIIVTSHNRVVGGYLCASELDHYERFRGHERRAQMSDPEVDDSFIEKEFPQSLHPDELPKIWTGRVRGSED